MFQISQPHNKHRREFLQIATAASLTPWMIGSRVAQANAALERVSVGVIGTGGRGFQVMNEFLRHPSAQIVAVCDVHELHYRDNPWGKGARMGAVPARELVDNHYASKTKSGQYAGCNQYKDYRRVLEREDIDAVLVATPDHWHAKITIDALRAGKDVYCEKPVTHYFAEGLALMRAVAERQAAGKPAVFQVGSQQRSDSLFRRAVEIVRNGHLGKLSRVEVGLPPGYENAQASIEPTEVPRGLDYDMWCGPAELLAYLPARHHRWWRTTRAFGGGVLMDWIGHHNDIAHWALDQDTGGPTRVEAVNWTPSRCPIYDTPHQYEIICSYPGGVESRISTKVKLGTKWIGEAGWLWVNRGKIEASNPQWLTPEFNPGDWQAYHSDQHVDNFLQCIGSRKPCIAPAETGHRSITPGHLGYVSHALSKPLTWDAVNHEIVGDDQAMQLLRQTPQREPWKI
ncbi:MAG: Gfo/Idh/MocA family oxidoreductase [Pirellulaceae bacterium]